jgi:hypothetical protein
MLRVSAARAGQGHLQATHILRSLLHCTLGQIVLLRHIIVVINFDVVGCFSSYLLYCGRFYTYVSLGVPFTRLYMCCLYKEHKGTIDTHILVNGITEY